MKHNIESDLFRLEHILDCIDRISILVDTCKTIEIFKNRWIEQDAMIRNFEIIGEASSHISEETKQKHTTVEWFKMKGMRNFISHEYFGVKIETIWDTAIENIPILKNQITYIISNIDSK